MFNSRWGEPLTRILAAYPPGPGLIAALETLIKSAEAQVQTRSRDELAAAACEGIHPGKAASGIKCLTCYETMALAPVEATVAAEVATARRQGGEEEVVEATLVE